MSKTVKHPIFACVCHRMSAKSEEAGEAEHRRELVRRLHGRVLELGAGNGLNFERSPSSADEVVAVEPEVYLRGRALFAPAARRILGTARRPQEDSR